MITRQFLADVGEGSKAMFKLRRTVIAPGMKFVGSITGEGSVKVRGQFEGDLHCAHLTVSQKGHINGAIEARRLVVDGKIDGPIRGEDVLIKSQAHVTGNIECQTLTIEKGARVEGTLAFAADKSVPARMLPHDPARHEKEAEILAEAEASTRLVELVSEAQHQSGNPNFETQQALAYLAQRGNREAKKFLK